MKWPYFIRQKLKTALALAVVFLLVICTNLLDRMHFEELHETINSVHKDRLLVENYIYNISQSLNDKRTAMYDHSFRGDSVSHSTLDNSNKIILSNINDFWSTVLTKEEGTVLNELAKQIEVLKLMEGEFLINQNTQSYESLDKLLKQYELLDKSLSRLEQIQLEEGKKLVISSNKILSISNISSRLEIAILIILGLIIQIIVISSKSLKPKIPQNSNLN